MAESDNFAASPDRCSKDFRPHLSVVIGGDCSDGSETEIQQDMRSRMQSFAINPEDDGGMPDSTVFVEDADVITMPSTSQAGSTVGGSDLLFSASQRTISNYSNALAAAPPNVGGDDDDDMEQELMRNFVKESLGLRLQLLDDDAPGQQQHAVGEANFLEEIFTEKPPKILENYLFGHVIGEGSYSKVKEVVHVQTLERRAVKIIKDKRLRKIPGGEQNVQREIEVLRKLSHPNVVRVVNIFRIEERQKLYIVMEFCVCSIQQLLDNCPEKMLPEFQAHLYFTQLIEGLDFLHSQRIIHKDIKPGNLLLSLNGVLKICDLGVAELLDSSMVGEKESDWCTQVQGTPKFQPPEVVSGSQKRFRGRLVDVWSCGVTLYNMVSGCYPFDGDVIMKLFENITTAPLEMPAAANISKSLAQLLTGMLQKRPEKRLDILKIRASKWFNSPHEIDKNHVVRIPAIKDTPSHRPLGIYEFLFQLYAQEENGDGEVASNYEGSRQQEAAAKMEHEEGRRTSSSVRDNLGNNDAIFSHSNECSSPAAAVEAKIKIECGSAAATSNKNSEENPILSAAAANNNNTARKSAARRRGRRKANVTKLLLIGLCSIVVLIVVVVIVSLLALS